MSERSKTRVSRWSAACARILGAGLIGMLLFSGAAKADAIEDAARHYHLNADLLRAIGYYESHLNAAAFHRNKNGSVDIGLMQINSIHLASLRRQGIDANMLKDAHVNADVGASLLRRHIDEYGPTWQAVGEYHSHNAVLRVQYARAIHDIYMARPWAGMKHEPALAPRDDEELVVQDIAAD